MSKLKSMIFIFLAMVIAVIVIIQVLVEYKEHPRVIIAVEKINKFINDKRMFVTIGGRKDEEPVVIDDILTDINISTINDGNRLGFHKASYGPLFILNVAAGNKSVDAKWDVFKVYGVIDMKRYPNYERNLKCCFLFNSDGDQEVIEIRPIAKEHFWNMAILRTFHVTCPNPRIGAVPDGVSIDILQIPCRSGIHSYITPFYPHRQPGTTIALGTKIAYGNISPELIIEWMETYKFLGVDKVVTYYVQDLNPSALQVLQYYAVEGSLDLYLFEPAASDLYPRTYHPPNPQKWNDNNVAAKDQFERMSGYTYFGILDHDEFLIPSRNRSLKQMMDDLFKRYNGTVANFEFGEIQFSLSWEATGMVRDLYLDRYIRRTDFPLDFLIRKNIYRPSMINAGSLNTHFISPRNLTERASRKEGYIRHFRTCKSSPLIFCLQYFRRITDKEMANWANNIRANVHHVRKQVFGNEKVFVI